MAKMLVVLFSRSVTVRGPSSESRRSSSQWLHIVVLVINSEFLGVIHLRFSGLSCFDVRALSAVHCPGQAVL